MKIGLYLLEGRDGLDDFVGRVRSAEEAGFATAWVAQVFGFDALTALAVAGTSTRRIELGTAVVPTYPRHPMALAGQALTTQAASGGRLTLGIGLSHQMVIEGMWGYSFERPARHMAEYLAVLGPLVKGEAVAFEGETVKASGQVTVPGAAPVPVLVAALGPRMLRLAGQHAEGTVTWMVGPRTLEGHIAPTITAAARDVGLPEPRVAMGLPVCVTADPGAARERAAKVYSVYGQLPSYRAMLDREGAGGPADVAVVGDEDEVAAAVRSFSEAGATDFVGAPFGNAEERDRTTAVLAALART